MGKNILMISILGILLFLSSGFIVDTQEKIDSYSMSALGEDAENFDINISNDNTLWIDMYSTSEPGTRCGFKLDEHYKPNFISTLRNARDLYTEWKRFTIENNIQEIKKKMHFIFYTGGYFSYFDMLKHDDDVRLIFGFTYFKGDYVLIMNLDKMTADDNDLITFNGASIIFNSEEEINSFLDKISPDSISNVRAGLTGQADN